MPKRADIIFRIISTEILTGCEVTVLYGFIEYYMENADVSDCLKKIR